MPDSGDTLLPRIGITRISLGAVKPSTMFGELLIPILPHCGLHPKGPYALRGHGSLLHAAGKDAGAARGLRTLHI